MPYSPAPRPFTVTQVVSPLTVGRLAALLFTACAIFATVADAQPQRLDANDTVIASLRTTGTVAAADGSPIAYESRGHGDTAVLFIHGWGADRSLWTATMDALEAEWGASVRLIAIDLPGHGRSPLRPGAQGHRLSFEAFGGDIAAVAKILSLDRLILVGHCFGGAAALEALPHLTNPPLGVITVETDGVLPHRGRGNPWASFRQDLHTDFDGTCRRFVAAAVSPPTDDARQDQLTTLLCEDLGPEPPDRVELPLWDQLTHYAPGAQIDLSSNSAPTVSLRGAQSTGNDPQDDRPSTHTVVEGSFHFPMIEAPEAFINTLRAALTPWISSPTETANNSVSRDVMDEIETP